MAVDAGHKKRSGNISEAVADKIMAMIADGRLAPGQRLPGERQLAEQMGVSRVSVRAALQKLKTRGFLDAVQGGGTRVIAADPVMDPALTELVRLNHDNLRDLAELRMVLEMWAARRAARSASPAALDEMEAIMAAMAADGGRGKSRGDDDMRFHLAIAKASGSTVFMHIVSVIRDILKQNVEFHRYEMLNSKADDRQILAHHAAILEAIKAGDPDAAAEAMRQHLTWVLSHYDAAASKRRRAPT